ncbi:MAG: hypothetical protein KME17_15960 [Cyanosarcina radialis HA8281-LM2]|jgi:hypothetical protein|nr:hypothetical protein [Cyanosarcina radialis HA8281-LM2]
MNEYPINHKTELPNSDAEEMLEEYDFSRAKPGRYRGFKGKLIRVLADGTEVIIETPRPTAIHKGDSGE